MSHPVARAATTWSHLLVIIGLLAASLLFVAPERAAAASMKAPSGLKASATTSTTLTVTWNATAKAPRYRLKYSTSSKMTRAKHHRDGDTTSTLEGLKPGQAYYVKVRVIKSNGDTLSPYSKAVKIKTLTKDRVPPAAPPAPTPTVPPTPTPIPTVSPTPTALPTPTTPSRLHLPANPSVLLVGDSYTAGVGAVPLTNGYAYKIADPLGWTLTRDGKWGSGYVNATEYGAGIFADRLRRHPADGFDLIVIQGSSNDVKYRGPELENNLNLTLGLVRERFPRAQVLMVGPTNPYGNPGAHLVRVNDQVKAAAASWSVPFVDALAERWFVRGDGQWAANPANGHPSNAGYQTIADRLVADVRALS